MFILLEIYELYYRLRPPREQNHLCGHDHGPSNQTKPFLRRTLHGMYISAYLSMKSAPCSSFSEAILPLSSAVKNVSAAPAPAPAEVRPTAVLLTRVCLEVVKWTPPTLRCTI